MTRVRAARRVVLAPEDAEELWLDVSRWATFVEGFAQPISRDGSWPAQGSTLVWQSLPGGRGTVNEKVTAREPGRVSTRVVEESLHGVQTVSFKPDGEGGSIVELELEYEINPTSIWRQGPVGWLTNLLFIRRAMTDSLARTLRRFATEAAEQQSL